MAKRQGATIDLGIPLELRDLELLTEQAEPISARDLSTEISETTRIERESGGRDELSRWLGEGRAELTEEVMNAIRSEWCAAPLRGRRMRSV